MAVPELGSVQSQVNLVSGPYQFGREARPATEALGDQPPFLLGQRGVKVEQERIGVEAQAGFPHLPAFQVGQSSFNSRMSVTKHEAFSARPL